MMNIKHQKTVSDDDEIAKRIVSLLNEHALNLDANVASKLSHSRQQALANMAKSTSLISIGHNGLLRLFGGYWQQYRLLMALLMCGFGVVVLLTIQNTEKQEAQEQGDAYLLASELPPELYLNEGFGTWLSENTQQ